MTRSQKFIVAGWLYAATLLVFCSIFHDWIQERWFIVIWPAFAIALCLEKLSRPDGLHSSKYLPMNIEELSVKHPWVKLYIAIYGLLVAVFSIAAVLRLINASEWLGFTGLLLAILGIIFPIIFIQQREVYRRAGDEI